MKYKIILAGSVSELATNVQALIDQGWRPQGGICTTPLGNFAQAMVLA